MSEQTCEGLSAKLLAALDKPTSQPQRLALTQNALQEAYEAGLQEGVRRFGPPCQRHEKVLAWLMPGPEDYPGQPGCFGCYVEGLQVATRRLVEREMALRNSLPPSDSLPPED